MVIKTPTRRFLIILAVLTIGAFLALMSGYLIQRSLKADFERDFQLRAADQAASINHQLRTNLEVLRSVCAFFESSQNVERDEFARFALKMLEHNPDFQALQWVPRVSAQQRGPLEAKAGSERPGYQIRERTPTHAMVPATPKPEYFPILYVQPFETNSSALGFDLGSDPVRLRALENARDSGRPSVSDVIQLIQFADVRSGFLIVLPVYDSPTPPEANERRQTLKGFVIGVFQITVMLENALQACDRKGINIRILSLDSGGETAGFVHFLDGQSKPQSADAKVMPLSSASVDATYVRDITVADQIWRVEFSPSGNPYRSIFITAGVASFGVLALTVLFAAYLFAMISRSAHAETQVALRTQELKEQKATLNAVVAGVGEGIIVADLQGRFLLFNAVGEEILGLGAKPIPSEQWSEAYGVYREDRTTLCPPEELPLVRAIRGVNTDGVILFIRNDRVPAGKFISVTGRTLQLPDGTHIGGVVTLRDVTEVRRLAEQLKADAVRDALTGLYNRRYFDEQMPIQLRLTMRHKEPFCLAFCDLDKFKEVNDLHGHPMGDKVIRAFAHTLREELRLEDIAFRLGGDEFAILFQKMNGELSVRCMERIRRRWESTVFQPDKGPAFQLSCSIGIAVWCEQITTIEQMIEKADQALYRAKQQGRNQVAL